MTRRVYLRFVLFGLLAYAALGLWGHVVVLSVYFILQEMGPDVS